VRDDIWEIGLCIAVEHVQWCRAGGAKGGGGGGGGGIKTTHEFHMK
jgi:hypothetical protein